MKTIPSASALGLGNSNLTAPVSENGFSNTANLANEAGSGMTASSALPFGLTTWQTANLQAWHGLNNTTGIGAAFSSSGIETYREQRMGLYIGKKLMRNLWLSSELYWLNINAPEYDNQNGYSFGLSVLSKPMKNVLLAMKLYNPIQASVGTLETPVRLETGLSYSFSKMATLYGAFEKDLDTPLQLKAGMKYSPTERFSLRFGYQSQPARPSFGLGYEIVKNLRLDVAAEWDTTLGITPGLGIVWNKKKLD